MMEPMFVNIWMVMTQGFRSKLGFMYSVSDPHFVGQCGLIISYYWGEVVKLKNLQRKIV